MLALIGDQLTPLSNNCDSASGYFREGEDRAGNDLERDIQIDIAQEFGNLISVFSKKI